MSTHVTEANDITFNDEVMKETGMVVVDFWAPWCGPCTASAPIFEKAAGETSDVKFVKINIDECIDIPTKYHIRSIPTFLVFEGGNIKDRHVGTISRSVLEKLIKKD